MDSLSTISPRNEAQIEVLKAYPRFTEKFKVEAVRYLSDWDPLLPK